MIFAIDFDGTICFNAWPKVGREIPGSIETIKKIAEFNIIILWTCRSGDQLTEAVEFCKSKGLIFDYVNENAVSKIDQYGSDCRKIFADYYIDDKSIFCRDVLMDWKEIEKRLKGVSI